MMNGTLKQRLRSFASEDALFFFSYGLFLATSLLSTSFYYRLFMGSPYSWVQAVCMALLVLREYRSGASRQSWGAMAVLGVLCILSVQATFGNLTRLVPLMFFYIYAARNIPFRRIARFSLLLGSAVVAFVVVSGYLCIIDNVVVAKGTRVREYMGFRYALYLPGLLLNLTALWIYLNKERVSLAGVAFWALANWFAYFKTDSRISFALALVLLGAALLMRFFPALQKKGKWAWVTLTSSYGLCAALSYFFTGIYNGSVPWMRRMNSMLESRLSLGKRSLEDHGFGLLGRDIEWIGNGLDAYGNTEIGPYSYVDCFYVKTLQRYGLLFTAALLSLLTWAMVRLWKHKQYMLLLICASVAAHCVLDDLSFALHYNTFWIAMGTAIMNPKLLEDD